MKPNPMFERLRAEMEEAGDAYEQLAQNILKSLENRQFDTQLSLEQWVPKTPAVRETYAQDWPAYNKAKTNENVLFKRILLELLTIAIENVPKKKRGRPAISIQERIFAMCVKIYYKSDLRKTEGILKELKNLNLIHRVPCFKSIDNFFNDESLSEVLDRLIFLTALPLAQVEKTGAIDATGFSTSQFQRWHDYKWGKVEGKERVWRKAHACVGCKTNTFLGVKVTEKNVGDNRMFKEVVGDKTRYFNMENFVADMAYLSRETLLFIEKLGLTPYIPFKKNSTGKSRGHSIWRKMWLEFTYNREEFMKKYHKRSNVETCFAMVKMRFGSHLMTKTLIANTNEIKVKVLCHNICVLIQEVFELGIDINFEACVKKRIMCKN